MQRRRARSTGTIKAAIWNLVKEAAVNAEMDGCKNSADSKYFYYINSRDSLLKRQFIPKYYKHVSSCIIPALYLSYAAH